MGNYYKAFYLGWVLNQLGLVINRSNLSAEKDLDRLRFSAEYLGVVIDRLCFLTRSPNSVRGVSALSCIVLSRQTSPYLSLMLIVTFWEVISSTQSSPQAMPTSYFSTAPLTLFKLLTRTICFDIRDHSNNLWSARAFSFHCRKYLVHEPWVHPV